jgi:hypothetical protein
LRLKNKGDKTESYRIDYSPRIDMPGVEFKVPLGDLIEIAAGQVIDIPVELSANPADMQHSRDKTVNAIQGQARHWMAEEAGYLLLWPADGAFDVSLSAAALATPIESDSQATAGLVFSPTTGAISYTIEVEATSPVTEISLRRAFPDTNGQIIERLYSSNPTGMVAGAVTELFSGTVVLGEFDKALLTAGNIYLQINTATFPDGELRGPLQARTPILNVPIHAAPRPTALLSASPELTFGPDEQSRQSLVFSGVDLSGSRPPTDVISLASVFVLQSASPPLPTETGGTKSTEAAAADIQYVGIVSDYEQVGSVEGSMLYFTITTYGKRSSPAEVTFNILIDIDEDGDADFRLFNADELGYVNRFRHSDAFVAVVEDLNRGVYIAREPLNALSPAQINSGVFEANFIVLPVRAASLGLNSERNRFSYGVSSELPDRDGSIDLVSKQQYDLISAQILPQLGGEYEPYVALFDGATIPIHYSGEGGSEAMRLLVIQPHNDIVEQVQIVDVDYRWLYDFYLPALVID